MESCYLNSLGGCGLVDAAEILGGFGTFAAAIVAILAIIYARRQIREARAFQFEAAATTLYHEFLFRKMKEEVWAWEIPTNTRGELAIVHAKKIEAFAKKFDAWNQYVRAVSFSTGHYLELLESCGLDYLGRRYLAELLVFSTEELNRCTAVFKKINETIEATTKTETVDA